MPTHITARALRGVSRATDPSSCSGRPSAARRRAASRARAAETVGTALCPYVQALANVRISVDVVQLAAPLVRHEISRRQDRCLSGHARRRGPVRAVAVEPAEPVRGARLTGLKPLLVTRLIRLHSRAASRRSSYRSPIQMRPPAIHTTTPHAALFNMRADRRPALARARADRREEQQPSPP
jgi:hypothetical protein